MELETSESDLEMARLITKNPTWDESIQPKSHKLSTRTAHFNCLSQLERKGTFQENLSFFLTNSFQNESLGKNFQVQTFSFFFI